MIVESRALRWRRRCSGGMEITAVDGEPPIAYARREVDPFQSASTQQNRDVRTSGTAFCEP